MRPTHPDVTPVPRQAWAPLPASPAAVIAALRPLVTDARIERLRRVISKRSLRVVPVLEELIDPHNISAVLRSADAFGLARMHVIEGERGFRAAKRVSKGAHRWLDIRHHGTGRECIEHLRGDGYEIFAAAMEGTIRPEELRSRPKVAVVFGNEHRGASEAMRSGADGTFAVPMVGFVESLNVSVAAAITLYTARGDSPGDLDEAQRHLLMARFLMISVRDARRIVLEDLERRG